MIIHSLEDLIRFNEGSIAFVYDDATGDPVTAGYTLKGNPTVGVGRNLAAVGLNAGEISNLLGNDLHRAESAVADTLGEERPRLGSPRYAALADMAFSLGHTRFLGFAGMLKAIRLGNWTLAAAEVRYRNPPNDERETPYYERAPARAERNMAMMITNTWPPAPPATPLDPGRAGSAR